MNNKANNLPRPTAEIIREYDMVDSELSGLDPSWSSEEANACIGKWDGLRDSYDWSNIEFIDPVTGKKGLKDLKGELIIPALYDAFSEPGLYTDDRKLIVAIKDGKYGILSCTGSAEIIVPFEYDHIASTVNYNEYICRKGNLEETICP